MDIMLYTDFVKEFTKLYNNTPGVKEYKVCPDARIIQKYMSVKANRLNQEYEEKNIDRQTFRFALMYKLSEYVGLAPLKFVCGTNVQTKSLLYDKVIDFYKAKLDDRTDLYQVYKDIKRRFKMSPTIGFTEGGKVKLPANFAKFNAVLKQRNAALDSILNDIDVEARQNRKKWLHDDVYKNCDPPIDLSENKLLGPKIHEIVYEYYDTDKINLVKNQTKRRDASIANDQEFDIKCAFNIFKLLRNFQAVDVEKMPTGLHLRDCKNYLTMLDKLEESIEYFSSDTIKNSGLYLTPETQDKIKEKLNDLAKKPPKAENNVDASKSSDTETAEPLTDPDSAGGKTKRSMWRRSLDSVKPKNVMNRMRRHSAPPNVSAAEEKKASTKPQPQPEQQSSDWQKATPDKTNTIKRKRHLFSATKMKYHTARLIKITDEKKLEDELNKLAANYSEDNEEQEIYREQLARRVRMNQFVHKYNDKENDIYQCYEVINTSNSGGELPTSTLKFYQKVRPSKNFKEFLINVFNAYYENNKQWVNLTVTKNDLVRKLKKHCFNIQASVLPEKQATGRVDIKISSPELIIKDKNAMKNFGEKDRVIVTDTISIPSNYEDLGKEIMKIIYDRYKRNDSKLAPKFLELYKKAQNTSCEKKANDMYKDLFNAGIIKGGPNRTDTIDNHMGLFIGKDKEIYKDTFEKQILESDIKSFDKENSRGKLKGILNAIWSAYHDYKDELYEARYNASMDILEKEMLEMHRKRFGINPDKPLPNDPKLEKIIGDIGPAPNMKPVVDIGSSAPPDHLPPEAIKPLDSPVPKDAVVLPDEQPIKKDNLGNQTESRRTSKVAQRVAEIEQMGENSKSTKGSQNEEEKKNSSMERGRVNRLKQFFDNKRSMGRSKPR